MQSSVARAENCGGGYDTSRGIWRFVKSSFSSSTRDVISISLLKTVLKCMYNVHYMHKKSIFSELTSNCHCHTKHNKLFIDNALHHPLNIDNFFKVQHYSYLMSHFTTREEKDLVLVVYILLWCRMIRLQNIQPPVPDLPFWNRIHSFPFCFVVYVFPFFSFLCIICFSLKQAVAKCSTFLELDQTIYSN